ncbi:MAG: TetR/AcrR family transcriptional regulator [Burkholderiaceae bacterium]
MKAKSDLLAAKRQESTAPAEPGQAGARRFTSRMPAAERKAQILAKAFEFFSEYGLTAQTRGLAEACGVSQRLLYSVFPNKAALINAVYEANIAGPFKAVWLVQLRDRNIPLEQRLLAFYREYVDNILTRGWLRLFLYASLAEVEMAPTYIAAIIKTLLDTVVEEAAADAQLPLPEEPALRQEIGWLLHGNVSHLAIRRHIYHDATPMPMDDVIRLHVKAYLAAVPALLGPGVSGGEKVA